MQRTATPGKKLVGDPMTDPMIRGWGHHNLLLIKDYATGDAIFRAETEIHLTRDNGASFERIEEVLRKTSPTEPEKKEIEGLLHTEVEKLSSSADGKKRAKAIFSAALGLLP